MKKEQVTIFNLEDAFKALDELEIPKAERGIKANKTDLVESFKDFNRSRTDLLMEDYYDIADSADLEEAKAEREAEVAKAKLARIEKIVDLEADSEEDLLPSYVGKMIIQCPQCMTLFYKDEADIVKSETDDEVVNVAEACQHCGNDAGYTLIGKVEGVNEEELIPEAEDSAEEISAEEENLDLEPTEEAEETPEEGKEPSEEGEENLDLVPVKDSEKPESEKEEKEEEKEEVVEESLQLNEETQNKVTENIVEAIDKDLQDKLDDHNDYIKFLQEEICKEEKALEEAKNEFIKEAIQRRLDALKEDLEKALPEEVKDLSAAEEEAPVEETETEVENMDAEVPVETTDEPNSVEADEVETESEEPVKESLTEAKSTKMKELSGAEFNELMDFCADQKIESFEENTDKEPEQLEEIFASGNAKSPYIKLGFNNLDPAYIFWKEDVEAELEKLKAEKVDLSDYVDEKGKYTIFVKDILGELMKTTDMVKSEDVDIENKIVKTSKGQTYTFAEIVEKAINLKDFTAEAAGNKGIKLHLTFVEKLRTYTDAFERKEVKIAQKVDEINNSEHSEDVKEWLANEVESIVVTLKGCDDIAALCAECGIEEMSRQGKNLKNIINSLNRKSENFSAKYPEAETEYLDALDSSDTQAANPVANFSMWGLEGVVKFKQKLHAPGYMHPEVINMIDDALSLTIQQAKEDTANFKQSFEQCTGYKVENFNFVLMLGELFGNLSFYKETIEESFEELEDIDEKCFAKCIGEALNRKEKTVKAVKIESCSLAPDNKLIVECKVKLLDNTTAKINYICEGFISKENQKLIKGITEGYINKEFICNYTFENRTLITESIRHSK